MRRDPKTGLVRNEKLLLIAFIEIDTPSIYPYALTRHWKQNPKGRSLSYSTLYRCLAVLEERGFLASSPSVETSGGPTRRQFQLTKAGRSLALTLQGTTTDRLATPAAC